MSYATVKDVKQRSGRELAEVEEKRCLVLLEDAAVIVDAYNEAASADAKKLVSCTMVIRAMGDGEASQFPIGSTQGTVSALGYSQTFTMGSGSTGELYLTRLEKKLLGTGQKIGVVSPWGREEDPDA